MPVGSAEIEFARETARQIGCEPVVISPTAQEFQREFDNLIWHMDQPVATAAAMSFFLLAKRASQDVKVVLAGEGSDEIFNGYIRHLLMAVESDLSSRPELQGYQPLAQMFWNADMFGPEAELSRAEQN